jgi:RNA polymerase sigma-70 factor (ECF subfamily)
MADESRTSITLLGHLRRAPEDQAAWGEFVERYGQVIHRWCRHWGLQEADAQDLTQNVLLELTRQMRTFQYDPTRRFRAWLRTVAHRAWCDFLDARARRQSGSGDSTVDSLLRSVPASENLLDELEAECERELLAEAMKLVEPRVEARTWDAFRLTAIEAVSAADVAQRLAMPVGSVYQAKSRVQRMLQDAVLELEGASTQ